MKIGIVSDGPKISGSMKYILQLYDKLSKKEETYFFHLMYEGELNLKSQKVEELKPIKIPFFNYFINFGVYYPLISYLKARKNSLNLMHFSRHYPMFILWNKLLSKRKIVVTSLDLYNLSKKTLFVLKTALKKVDKIIAISEATKRDLVELGIEEKKIEVVYLGVDNKIFRPISKNEALNLLSKTKFKDRVNSLKKADKIILSISNDTKRKNTSRVYDAFFKFLHKNPNSLLLRVVTSPDNKVILEQTKRFKDRIIFLQGLSEEEMSFMYNLSDLLIFPSIWEGFGLPLLESISCGTPCVTSNFQPMTEVVGDSGTFVDPYSTESIYGGIVKCLKDRDRLSKESLRRSKFFSLDKNFRETYDIYKNLLNTKG